MAGDYGKIVAWGNRKARKRNDWTAALAWFLGFSGAEALVHTL